MHHLSLCAFTLIGVARALAPLIRESWFWPVIRLSHACTAVLILLTAAGCFALGSPLMTFSSEIHDEKILVLFASQLLVAGIFTPANRHRISRASAPAFGFVSSALVGTVTPLTDTVLKQQA